MEISNITIILTIIISITISLITLILFNKLQTSRYDDKNNKALLESIRYSLEDKMYRINDRLIQSEERWRDVNHLLLNEKYLEKQSILSKNNKIHYSGFLKENGIEENDLIIDEKLIFILTPFHDKYYEDYKVIRDTCTQNGYRCFRGDENYFKSDIFPEMLRLIVKSKLIIANINGRNPNVLYELGIAQALDKSILLISKNPENLPIDIKSKRFLIYTSYSDLQEKIRQEIFKMNNIV
ncbi:hypothetical protein [Tenacibaculum aiptasiae]|uniref:hypothetical protein n=1 Tax=Tenacibaculum aiptasiae TaxID=426481 RepID=UPI003B5AAC3E